MTPTELPGTPTRSASVVVTCYNLADYIAEAVTSVLAQDWTGSTEIIVIDDCSTDSSADEIRSLEGVHYVRTPQNGGVLEATLLGLTKASNDLIFLLDGDDVWEPQKLRRCVARFDEDAHLAFLTHDLRYIGPEGQPLERTSAVARSWNRRTGDEDTHVREGVLRHDDNVWLGSAIGVRRSIADIDGFISFCRGLPDPRHTYQDWPLAYWVASQPDARMGLLPERLFRYRLHGANHSGDARSLPKARRNAYRSFRTAEAMEILAARRHLAQTHQSRARQVKQYYRFLMELYDGAPSEALRALLSASPYVRQHGKPLREAARLALFGLLPPERANWVTNKLGA